VSSNLEKHNVRIQSFLKENASRVETTIFCIGLGRYHDARLLNTIAKSGSKLGNFIYIDTDKENYKETMVEALGNSLEMAISSSGTTKIHLQGSQTKISLPCKMIYNFPT
jgi:hypothetical protein